MVSGACTVTSDATCFRSPNYPSNYGNNQHCNITVAAHEHMMLSVVAFDLEQHPSCSWDALTVNGVKYCGTSVPDDVMVAPGGIIAFSSDEVVPMSGF